MISRALITEVGWVGTPPGGSLGCPAHLRSAAAAYLDLGVGRGDVDLVTEPRTFAPADPAGVTAVHWISLGDMSCPDLAGQRAGDLPAH
jgi:hypothetical protein